MALGEATRRKFRNWMGTTGPSEMALTLGQQYFFQEMSSRLIVDQMEEQSREVLLKDYDIDIEENKNPGYVPFDQIVERGIASYQQRTGKKPYYQFSPGRMPEESFWQLLEKQGILEKVRVLTGDQLVGALRASSETQRYLQSIQDEVFYALQNTDGRSIPVGEGEWIHSSDSYASLLSVSGNIRSWEDIPVYSFGAGFARHYSTAGGMKESIDEARRISNEFLHIVMSAPRTVSTSEVFDWMIEACNGEIHSAVGNMYLILKLWARNDIQSDGCEYLGLEVARYPELIERFSNLRDEYYKYGTDFGIFRTKNGKFVSQQDNLYCKDLSRINKLGIYHPWAMLYNLWALPISAIRLTWAGVDLAEFKNQGPMKLMMDFAALNQLDNFEKYFVQYGS